MATVQYTKMWLTEISSQVSLGAQTAPDRRLNYGVKGEVRTYASGRQRAVGSIGTAGRWTFTLAELVAADVALLKTWLDAGVTLFARDHRGQSMYGVFFDLETGENMSQLYTTATYTASIVLQQVDVTEGV